jgi:hypothetical protein
LAHRLQRERVRALAGGRAYCDPGKKKKKRKQTTTSRYTIPQRNGYPATAITSRPNCVLIRCLNIHLMLLSTYPLRYLELATHFSNAFPTLSLYCGLFNDFFKIENGRKLHAECQMTLQRKIFLKSPPEFASNPPLGENGNNLFYFILDIFLLESCQSPSRSSLFF